MAMEKGYGKTLENGFKKSMRLTSSDIVCIHKTKQKLQSLESTSGSPLDNAIIYLKKKSTVSLILLAGSTPTKTFLFLESKVLLMDITDKKSHEDSTKSFD